MATIEMLAGLRSHRSPAPRRRHATRPAGVRRRPHRARPAVDPGRTPGTAPFLRLLHRDVSIAGTLGPADAEHFYRVRVDAASVLRIDLASEGSVAGLQVLRSPDGQGDEGVPLGEALATTSTLVTDPATLAPALRPGCYLVRIYNFFADSEDYLLKLELRPPTLSVPEDREPVGPLAGIVSCASRGFSLPPACTTNSDGHLAAGPSPWLDRDGQPGPIPHAS